MGRSHKTCEEQAKRSEGQSERVNSSRAAVPTPQPGAEGNLQLTLLEAEEDSRAAALLATALPLALRLLLALRLARERRLARDAPRPAAGALSELRRLQQRRAPGPSAAAWLSEPGRSSSPRSGAAPAPAALGVEGLVLLPGAACAPLAVEPARTPLPGASSCHSLAASPWGGCSQAPAGQCCG